ncbi:MAG: alpha/beta hydrolase [Longimicrobiales bacterium]|nr:alpha/beta hydrolase [Longimicrobiales bacterium]
MKGSGFRGLAQGLRAARHSLGFWVAAATVAPVDAAVAQVGNAGPVERSAADSVAEVTDLDPGDSLGDLLDHPALAGFADRLLPWHGRTYDPDLSLDRIGSLLPYHTEVDPVAVVRSLNRLIDNANGGVPVFHEIYSEEERRADPGLRATGLFFFPGTTGAPFALIAPGGGFSYVATLHEGLPYAAEISARGYNAFVLTYRTGRGARAATADMARALDHILTNAGALGVATDHYSVWGSSAGARMAAAIGSYGTAAFGESEHPGPTAVVMAYTGHSDRSRDEPPTFVVVGGRDGIARPAAMERRIAALRSAGTEVEYHVYPSLGHGFGPGTGTEAEGWIGEAVSFWARQIEASR